MSELYAYHVVIEMLVDGDIEVVEIIKEVM